MKIISVAPGLLAALVIAASFIFPAAALADETVRIGISSNSLAYGGLRIAKQLGLFKENGIDAKITVLDSGSAATAALISDSTEFAGSGPGEALAARAKGIDIKIVANIYSGFPAPVVLSAKAVKKLSAAASASVAERFKALDQLSIAVPSATSALLSPVRESAKNEDAVPHFVYMAQPTMSAALQTGAIDGFVASSPYWVTSVLNRTGVVWLQTQHGELDSKFKPASAAVLQVRADYAAAHPKTVATMRAVFAELADRIRKDPDGAFRALIAAFPQVSADVLRVAFDSDSANWANPSFTADNVRQEISLLAATTPIDGLNDLDPSAVITAVK